MKYYFTFFFLTVLLFSCEKHWDDAIPEGATLGIPRLFAELNEEGKIILEWNFDRICFGWSCDPIVEGTRYEIFGKFPGENDFYVHFQNNPLSWVEQGRGVAVSGVNNESIQKLVKVPLPD